VRGCSWRACVYAVRACGRRLSHRGPRRPFSCPHAAAAPAVVAGAAPVPAAAALYVMVWEAGAGAEQKQGRFFRDCCPFPSVCFFFLGLPIRLIETPPTACSLRYEQKQHMCIRSRNRSIGPCPVFSIKSRVGPPASPQSLKRIDLLYISRLDSMRSPRNCLIRALFPWPNLPAAAAGLDQLPSASVANVPQHSLRRRALLAGLCVWGDPNPRTLCFWLGALDSGVETGEFEGSEEVFLPPAFDPSAGRSATSLTQTNALFGY
jgi:hypothetical protein